MSAPPSRSGTTRDVSVIHARLGSGSMATISRGVDVNPHRSVVVKVLSPMLAANSAYIARVRRSRNGTAGVDQRRCDRV